jgi:glycosyltransferase involved in cell wall biosynthesis
MAGDGVEVVSPLGDPNDLLGRARLSVVPLLQGGGTRLKILESLAAGRPVVSTTKGAEGLDLGSLAGVTVADGPAALADAIIAELRSPLEAGRAEELRARVLSRYEWDTITAQLLATMRERFGSPWP